MLVSPNNQFNMLNQINSGYNITKIHQINNSQNLRSMLCELNAFIQVKSLFHCQSNQFEKKSTHKNSCQID